MIIELPEIPEGAKPLVIKGYNDQPAKSPMILNADHILGLLRFARNCPEIDPSDLSLAFYTIISNHEDLIETLEGPSDAIRTMLEEWYEIEE